MPLHPDVIHQLDLKHTKAKQSLQAEDVVETSSSSSRAQKPGKTPSCGLNQPHLSRYSRHNVSQHLRAAEGFLNSPHKLILCQVKYPLLSIMHGMNLIHQNSSLRLISWLQRGTNLLCAAWTEIEWAKAHVRFGTDASEPLPTKFMILFRSLFISNYCLWSILRWIRVWSHQFRWAMFQGCFIFHGNNLN